jgi:hypothetical protein
LEAKQKIIKHVFLNLALLLGFIAFAQQPNSEKQDSAAAFIKENPAAVHQTVIIEGDTVAWDILDEILFLPEPTFNDADARKNYIRLKRRVMKVYPYASMTGNKLDSVRLVLDDITKKRKRKKYIKNYQKYLEETFEPELKEFTRSEGQILCKLVHRETGETVFALIKEYRSGWNAWWWARFAGWYDIDIDKPYDPNENAEDKLIESILNRAFKTKMLEERVPFYPPARLDD